MAVTHAQLNFSDTLFHKVDGGRVVYATVCFWNVAVHVDTVNLVSCVRADVLNECDRIVLTEITNDGRAKDSRLSPYANADVLVAKRNLLIDVEDLRLLLRVYRTVFTDFNGI